MSLVSSFALKKIFEFLGVSVAPIIALTSSFWPNIYDALTEPDELYAYSTKYEKNPILEWNRAMSHFIKGMEAANESMPDEPARPLLKKIGAEVIKSLPAMLAGAGVRPLDNYTVSITNMSSRYDLKNIRVSFTGCKGVDSIRTYPDTIGSLTIKDTTDREASLSVSTSYTQIPRAVNESRSVASVIVYAEDASTCKPVVEATTSKGETALGKSVQDVSEYNIDQYWKKRDQVKAYEILWRFLLSVGILGMFFYVRSLRNYSRV